MAYQSEIELRVKVLDKELRDVEQRIKKITNPFSASGARRRGPAQAASLRAQKAEAELVKKSIDDLDRLRNRKAEKTLQTNLKRVRYLRDQRIKAERDVAKAARDVAKARSQKRSDVLLGGGFPLLFGGGPMQALGGAVGGALGGFGGSIAGSAIAQQLQNSLNLVSELKTAIDTLDMSALADSALTVNEELAQQVQLLKAAGNEDAARAAIAAETFKQFGLSAQSASLVQERVNAVKQEFDRLVGTVASLISMLATPFIAVLTPILRLVNMVVRGWTMIFDLVTKFTNLPGLNRMLGLVGTDEGAALRGMEQNEQARQDQEKQAERNRLAGVELETSRKLYELEQQRREGNSVDAQLQNKRLETQKKLLELRNQFDEKIRDAKGKEKTLVQQTYAVEKDRLKLSYQQAVQQIKLNEFYRKTLETARTQAQIEQTRISNAEKLISIQTSVADAQSNALLAINRLEQQRAKHAGDTTRQFKLQIQEADIIYRQKVIQVQQEVRLAQLAVLKIKSKIQESKIEMEIARMKGMDISNHQKLINLQYESLRITKASAKAAAQIGQYNIQAAAAIRQMTVEQIKFNRAQASAGGGGGGGGGYGGGGGGGGGGRALTLEHGSYGIGGISNSELFQKLYRAGAQGYFKRDQAIEYLRDKDMLAEGAYVTGPTNALVGERGENEYVIPESKMSNAIKRYARGARGESVVEGSSETSAGGRKRSGAVVNISTGPVMQMDGQDYVTVSDLNEAVGNVAAAMSSSDSEGYGGKTRLN